MESKFNPRGNALTTNQRPTLPTVGKTIGERRLLMQTKSIAPLPSADAFRKKTLKNEELAPFSPNTAYKQTALPKSEVPFKHPYHDGVEQGYLRKHAPKGISDQARVKFLDRIMSDPSLATAKTIQRTAIKRAAEQQKIAKK